MFAYGWQLADNIRGNGDGRLQRGEHATLFFTVKNTGRGRGFNTTINLKNLSGQGVLLHDGRFTFDHFDVGAEQLVAFTFHVEPGFRASERELKFEVQIEDEDLREFATHKIVIPLLDAVTPSPASGTWIAGPHAQGYETSGSDARVVARFTQGMRFPITASVGEWLRVDVAPSHPVWVRRAEAGNTAPPRDARVTWVLHNEPPVIETSLGDILSVRTPTLRITGTARDETRLLDFFVFVGPRKLVYRSNRNGTDPRSIAIDAEVALRPGSNLVTLVAREDADTIARRSFVIRRDGPNGELLATPRAGEIQDEDAEEQE
jgi:carboxyl-terminal processing protease